MDVTSNGFGTFIIRFKDEELWNLNGQSFFVRKWKPNLVMARENINRIGV